MSRELTLVGLEGEVVLQLELHPLRSLGEGCEARGFQPSEPHLGLPDHLGGAAGARPAGPSPLTDTARDSRRSAGRAGEALATCCSSSSSSSLLLLLLPTLPFFIHSTPFSLTTLHKKQEVFPVRFHRLNRNL